MSNGNTIVAKRDNNGSLVQVLPDGSTRPFTDATDWTQVEALSDEDVQSAALADPDAQPLSQERLAMMRGVPRVKIIRRALNLSQEEFAARYHIPVGTLRDWEQGRFEPDAAARSYLSVIAREPEIVRRALEPIAKPST